MITKVTHLTLFVKNQDEACAFYTEKLGFKVHTDETFGEMRWLTLHPASQPDFEISLMLAQNPQEAALIGKQAGKKPLFCLETTDCRKDAEALTQKGVTLLGSVQDEPWGISVGFEDPYGNAIYMCQPTPCQK